MKEKMYYSGVDMTNWNFDFQEQDKDFIYKAFIAVCNFAEEISGCAGCPLMPLCHSHDGLKGEVFWDYVHKNLAE